MVSPVPAPFTVATADLVQRCHGAGATVTVRLLRIAGVKLLAEQLHEEKEKPTGGGDTHPLVRPGDPPSDGYTAARCPQSHTAHACEKRSAFGPGVALDSVRWREPSDGLFDRRGRRETF